MCLTLWATGLCRVAYGMELWSFPILPHLLDPPRPHPPRSYHVLYRDTMSLVPHALALYDSVHAPYVQIMHTQFALIEWLNTFVFIRSITLVLQIFFCEKPFSIEPQQICILFYFALSKSCCNLVGASTVCRFNYLGNLAGAWPS